MSLSTPMKVLVVGNGGREHALAWKIRQSPLVERAVLRARQRRASPSIADCVPIDTSNIVEVADFAQTIKADLTVVGPELPMVLGHRRRVPSAAGSPSSAPAAAPPRSRARRPSRASSCTRHKIPSPRYEVCARSRRPQRLREAGALRLPVRGQGRRPGRGQGHARGARTRPRRRTAVDRDHGGQEVRHRGREAGDGGVPATARRSRSWSSRTARAWCRWSRCRTTSAPLDGDHGPEHRRHGHRLALHQHQPGRATSRSCRRSSCPRSPAWPRRGAATRACSTPG